MRILYIDIDSLRPDHLGCYGYHRNTSPTIDSVAKEAVRFNNYYTSDAPCLPSRTAFYSGRFGIHSGVVGHGDTAADIRQDGMGRGFRDSYECNALPTQLQNAGFWTAQISPFGQRHAARQFYCGFNEILNTGKGGMESAEDVTPVVDEWFDRNLDKDNWFLHLNYWDPHTPYRTPAEFENPFKEDPIPDWLTEEVFQNQLKNKIGPHSPHEINMYNDVEKDLFPDYPGSLKSMEDVKKMIDGYDMGVKYVDDQLAGLFQRIKDAGIWEDTAIIISADHGENMGELGIYGEHGTADQITTKVPLIVKWPGAEKGTVKEGLHYNLDLAPTLHDLLNLKSEKPEIWDGESFASSICSPEDSSRDYLVVSQCAHVCQRSVRFKDFIYIRTYHDGFHLFPKEMLFNLKEDPYQQIDLANNKKEICREALYYLNEWKDDIMETRQIDRDPLWTVMKEGGPFHAKGYLDFYSKQLTKTGRSWAIQKLREKHPREATNKQNVQTF